MLLLNLEKTPPCSKTVIVGHFRHVLRNLQLLRFCVLHRSHFMAGHLRGLRHRTTAPGPSTDQLRRLLRPLLKAYVLGYASSTTPRLVTLLVGVISKYFDKGSGKKLDFERVFSSVYKILHGGLEWQRFPTFCAALIGGTTLLQVTPYFLSVLGVRTCSFNISILN